MRRMREIIDVHAHILPRVDDGARSVKEACRLLNLAISQGVTGVIATPHDVKGIERLKLERLAHQIQEEIRREYPDFTVHMGQEAYYREGLGERLKNGQVLTMADSCYVLVEFSPGDPYEKMFRGLRFLISAGYVPILAHIERYACLRKEAHLLELSQSGCIFQMNYGSLAGRFFDSEVRWCRRQVKEGRVKLLGTDMHRMDFRPPKISEAMKWLEGHIDEASLSAMTLENPLRIIKHEKISQELMR